MVVAGADVTSITKWSFFGRLIIFILLVCILQAVYFLFFSSSIYEHQRSYFFDPNLACPQQILYFGDSTVVYRCDPDGPSLFEAVKERLGPQWSIGQVAHPAYSLTQYETFCRYLSKHDSRPEAVIIPINLRSFTTGWDMRPEWQFQRETVYALYDSFLYRVFFTPLTIFKAPQFNLSPIEAGTFQRLPVYKGTELVGTVKEFDVSEVEDLSQQFVFRYMQSIKSSDRKAQSLKCLARLGRQMNLKVIFYITPIDYETGIAELGDAFEQQITMNIETLQALAANEGSAIFDLSRLLSSDMFCHESAHPNEHVTSEGMAILAEEVATVTRAAMDEMQMLHQASDLSRLHQ